MSRSYDYWVEQQLEPTREITHEGTPSFDIHVHRLLPMPVDLSEQEKERIQDEYLAKHGIFFAVVRE